MRRNELGAFKDHTGQIYNRLTVLGRGENIGKHIRWKVRCQCGTETEIDAYALSHGKTQSCGCLQRERLGEASKVKPFESIYKALCNAARYSGNFIFLTYEQYVGIAESEPPCHYCGSQLIWCRHHKKGVPFGYNLDRINNDSGYTMSNVLPCCMECNYIKKCLPYDEAFVMIQALKEFRKLKQQNHLQEEHA